MKTGLTLLLLGCAAALTLGGMKTSEHVASLVEAERAFSRTSVASGMREAFLANLASDGIVFRPGPVNGPEVWQKGPAPQGLLSWEPVYADASAAGDLGYTTGPFEFRAKREDEKPIGTGHYFSIWKREPGSAWKVALDVGITHAPLPQRPALQTASAAAPAKRAAAKVDVERLAADLLQTERQFAIEAKNSGLENAYLARLAANARLMRENAFPHVGREAIRAALAATTGTLSWEPLKAQVSRSGDLAYDYGTYERHAEEVKERGYYVRVWKREGGAAGWRLALDIFHPLPPPKPAP